MTTDRPNRPLPPGALQLLDRERMVALAHASSMLS